MIVLRLIYEFHRWMELIVVESQKIGATFLCKGRESVISQMKGGYKRKVLRISFIVRDKLV